MAAPTSSPLLVNLEDVLLTAVEKTMRKIFKEIAAMDHVPTYLELKARYFPQEDSVMEEEPEEEKPKKAKAAPKAAKEVKEGDEKPKCQGTTVKGLPCKKNAMGGGCFCSVHNPAKEAKPPKEKKAKAPKGEALSEEDGEAVETPKEKDKKKAKAPGAPKKIPKILPLHNHEVDEEDHGDCEVCQSHGNAAGPSNPKYEVAQDLKSRLANILGDIDGSDGEEEEEKAEELIEAEGNLLDDMIKENEGEGEAVDPFGVDENGEPVAGFSDEEGEEGEEDETQWENVE